jgi:hypothetical protein
LVLAQPVNKFSSFVDLESLINKIIKTGNPLVSQAEGKRPLARSTYSWKDNIKAEL